MTDSEIIVSISNVRKFFKDVKAVNGVSLKIIISPVSSYAAAAV
jgi:ABC-type sugar transport system ATPase subunit